jgi:hypothetical protein
LNSLRIVSGYSEINLSAHFAGPRATTRSTGLS